MKTIVLSNLKELPKNLLYFTCPGPYEEAEKRYRKHHDAPIDLVYQYKNIYYIVMKKVG